MVGLVGERERREGITRDVASGDLSSEALEGSVTEFGGQWKKIWKILLKIGKNQLKWSWRGKGKRFF
jgi:hypothetical protein